MNNAKLMSQIAIGSAFLSFLTLLSLHFVSPELDPTWHMISEYAYGSYGWILSLFFFSWAVSYWTTGIALFSFAKHWLYRLGILLLLISGIGALMGGVFDVRHSLHGLAFGLGIPFLPIVAPFLTHHLQKKHARRDFCAVATSHAVWIGFVLMAVSMFVFISQMTKAGAMNMSAPQLILTLPDGVTPIIGITNRFLVVSYIGWLLAINMWMMKTKKKAN